MSLAANKCIPNDSEKIKQPHWIANEAKNVMHQKRQFKSNLKTNGKIHKEIQQKCKGTKEQ